MCYGQFSVTDPRCGNFSRADCLWCGYPLQPDIWYTTEDMLKHLADCPMYKSGQKIMEERNVVTNS